MTPELKLIFSADIDDLPNWTPEGEDVCFWLELSIGSPGSPAADIYQVCVATPPGLKTVLGRRIKPRGAAKARPIVVQPYTWPAVLGAIQERLE